LIGLGDENKDGSVNAEELIRIVKKEFEMSIDIEKLIQEVDEDQSGVIEFDEFKCLLKANYSNDLP
jgi:Ca2+-binding EF-hand superfamily protein